MNEKFNKNAKVEQLTKMFLSCEEEKGLIVKDPFRVGVIFKIFYDRAFFEKTPPRENKTKMTLLRHPHVNGLANIFVKFPSRK